MTQGETNIADLFIGRSSKLLITLEIQSYVSDQWLEKTLRYLS